MAFGRQTWHSHRLAHQELNYLLSRYWNPYWIYRPREAGWHSPRNLHTHRRCRQFQLPRLQVQSPRVDTPDNLILMSSLLKNDYKVKIANGGEKALRIASSESPPDLILLDIMMPDMDGYPCVANAPCHSEQNWYYQR